MNTGERADQMTTVSLAAHACQEIIKKALQHLYVNSVVFELQFCYSHAHVTCPFLLKSVDHQTLGSHCTNFSFTLLMDHFRYENL